MDKNIWPDRFKIVPEELEIDLNEKFWVFVEIGDFEKIEFHFYLEKGKGDKKQVIIDRYVTVESGFYSQIETSYLEKFIKLLRKNLPRGYGRKSQIYIDGRGTCGILEKESKFKAPNKKEWERIHALDPYHYLEEFEELFLKV